MDNIIDYSNQIEGTYFSFLDKFQGKGKIARGIYKTKKKNSTFNYFLYDAYLSQNCENEKDEAFVCVIASETIDITEEQYKTFKREGLFTNTLKVIA